MIKQYENGIVEKSNNEENLYSINQIIKLYPVLSKHILTNAINKGELKVTWIGNKRYFTLNDIDNYLSKRQQTVSNDIPRQLENWRNK